MIKVIIKLILKKFNGIELRIITEKAKQMLNGLNNFSKLEGKEKVIESKRLVAKYGKTSDTGKIMKNF